MTRERMVNELAMRPLVVAFAAALAVAWSGEVWASLLLLVPLVALAVMQRGWLWVWVVAGCLWGGVGRVDFKTAPFFEPSMVVREGLVQGAGDPLTLVTAEGTYRLGRGTNMWPGSVVRVEGRLSPLAEGFDGSSGEIGRLSVKSWTEVRGAPAWRAGPEVVRRRFAAWAEKTLHPSTQGLVRALCFNETTALSPADAQALRKSGTYHVVSASGMHIMFLAAGMMLLFRRLPVPYGVRMLLIGVVLVAFAVAVGGRPSIIRALLMAAVWAGAFPLRQQLDGPSAWALAGFVGWFSSPAGVADLGYQLSMAAVGGLMLGMNDENGWRGALKATLLASLGTLPLIAYHFGTLPLWGLPANLMVLPAVSATMVLALAGAVGLPVGFLIDGLAAYMRMVVHAAADAPGAQIMVPAFHAVWIGLLWLAWLTLWRPREVEP